jgi:hypothetical protein
VATNNTRILSVDVECVATDYEHDDQSSCSVTIVDDKCQIIFFLFVRCNILNSYDIITLGIIQLDESYK